MATADQVKALIKSHGEGDDDRFYAVAMQVAARAARAGQDRFAIDLRDLVDMLRNSQPVPRMASAVPKSYPSELEALLTVSHPRERLTGMSLSSEILQKLLTVVSEQRQKDRLAKYGLKPIHRLLLEGPPGTGKTLTAQVLAGELGVPLYAIRLDALITKFMGETAAKLRMIFDALASMRGVYLFDEVDSLASERSLTSDVGEIRRVLNSFLQFLERDDSDSLLIATTNHPQLLDSAFFRRFDAIVEYTLPNEDIAVDVILNRLASFDLDSIDWQPILEQIGKLSHADIAAAAESAAKESVLLGRTDVQSQDIVRALNDRISRTRTFGG